MAETLGTEAAIYEALVNYLDTMAANLSLPIAMPGASFTPIISKPYLLASIVPNTAALFGLEFDSDVDFQGLAQVSIYWPSGQGLVKPLHVASRVVAALAPGTRINRNGIQVRIDEQPSVSPSQVETDWTQIPVIARWRAFVPSDASAS